MRSARIVSTAGLLVVLVFSRDLRAEPPPATTSPSASEAEARELYETGARLYDLGEYDQAIDRFQRAYLIASAPGLLLNIAQAQRLKGACGAAAAAYRRYLEKVPDSPHRAEIKGRITAMEACANASSAGATPAAPEPTTAGPPPPVKDDASASSTRVPWTTVGWVGVGVATAGVLVAATGLALTLDAQSDLDATCTSDGACPRSASDRLDAYERWRTVAVAGAAVATLGAVVAVLGLVWPGQSNEVRRSAAPSRARALGFDLHGLRGQF